MRDGQPSLVKALNNASMKFYKIALFLKLLPSPLLFFLLATNEKIKLKEMLLVNEMLMGIMLCRESFQKRENAGCG